MIYYIAGKVRGLSDYRKYFKAAEMKLQSEGHIVLNPASLPEGLNPQAYMKICLPMLDAANGIYMLSNWSESEGANIELNYAKMQGKMIVYEES